MINQNSIIQWLLKGDPSIRWQTLRDLTDMPINECEKEQNNIANKGWGAKLLSKQNSNGTWGYGLYTPKWISTTYTLLLLRRFGLSPRHPQAFKGCALLLDNGFYHDGGINYFSSLNHSETCVTGMILSILCYFQYKDKRINRLVDHLLEQQMKDGGWNCQSYRGASHSSFHTTISVLEGLREFEKNSNGMIFKIQEAQQKGREFLLAHRLFRSSRTGEIVLPALTRFSFPPRWHYDILRALDYFQECGVKKDERLLDAIEIVNKKCKKDGRWLLQNRHPGKVFFEMERVGEPSRWNTLRALRVLNWWEKP